MANVLSLFETSMGTRPKVIAAIPCFNAEQFVGDVVSSAKKYVEQVVVIDDGSRDGSSGAQQYI